MDLEITKFKQLKCLPPSVQLDDDGCGETIVTISTFTEEDSGITLNFSYKEAKRLNKQLTKVLKRYKKLQKDLDRLAAYCEEEQQEIDELESEEDDGEEDESNPEEK